MATDQFSLATAPGGFVVNLIPLRELDAQFCGAACDLGVEFSATTSRLVSWNWFQEDGARMG